MRILITNDDGISAAGLAVAEAIGAELAGPDGEVWVVAPGVRAVGRVALRLLHPADAARAARGAPLRRRGLAGRLRSRRDRRDPEGRAARSGAVGGQSRPQRRRGHALFRHGRRGDGGGAARAARRSRCRSTTAPDAAAERSRSPRPARTAPTSAAGSSTGGAWTAAPYGVFYNVNFPAAARPPRCAACARRCRATAAPRPSASSRRSRPTAASTCG